MSLMSDVHSPDIRSKNMRAIRSRDTTPEMIVRRALHANGLRYSLHRRSLPGTPDLVFRQYRAVVFVHGCFWHGHDGCKYFKLPQSRREFWRTKIAKNSLNDSVALAELTRSGWRVAIVWECVLKQKGREELKKLTDQLSNWITLGRDPLPAVFSSVHEPKLSPRQSNP